MTPLELKILLEYYTGVHADVSEITWYSDAAVEARQRLFEDGITVSSGKDYKITEKGKAWVEFILATPMPVETTHWELPERTGKGA